MQNRHAHSHPATAPEADHPRSSEAELVLLKDVLAALPTGVTVLDEHGRFILMNDAAATQLGASDAADALRGRREIGLELLRDNRAVISEEAIGEGPSRQVWLTAHRPALIANRRLLISSSADISEQKTFEDQLFRSAYYDELTGLPSRRVIEHLANSLIAKKTGETFALAFLDLDNFKHIND